MTLLSIRKDNKPTLRSTLWDNFDLDRFFDGDFFNNQWMTRVPLANITENENQYSVELAVPGMNKDDFNINVEDNTLLISAEREDDTADKNDGFTRREYNYRSFSRSFLLPDSVMVDKINAKYEDGVLRFILPKSKEAIKKSRAIKVG